MNPKKQDNSEKIDTNDFINTLNESEKSIGMKWSEDYKERIERNIGFVTIEQQDKIKNAHIGVIGVGGTGSVPTEILARAGIGHFTIVDIDVYDKSNINRQIFASTKTIGQKKVDAAASKLKDINPEIEVRTFDYIDETNVEEFMSPCNILIIAADDHLVRIFSTREARIRNIPVVDGWGPLYYGNVNVIMPDGPTYEEILGLETEDMTIEELRKDGSLDAHSMLWTFGVEGNLSHVPNKLLLNIMQGLTKPRSFAPIVFLTGSLMAMEVIKLILNIGVIADDPFFKWYDPWLHRIPRQWIPTQKGGEKLPF